MTGTQSSIDRVATLAYLASAVPGQRLGRTAAMKLMYFLQTLYGVPLGYSFRMYSYGPFDSAVLDDIGTADALKAIREKTVLNPLGYRHESTPGPDAEAIRAKAAKWLADNRQALDAVAAEFGGWSAAQLELGSTIVFVDREFKAERGGATLDEIALRVREIKPRFSAEEVRSKVEQFRSKGFLTSVDR
jgi:uncharacterized protein